MKRLGLCLVCLLPLCTGRAAAQTPDCNGNGVPDDIDLAGKMYWTDSNKIFRANLDGSIVEELVTGLVLPVGIAVDPAAGKMYWTDQGSDKIQRANLDGSNVQDLVTGLSQPWGIAVDPAASKMYWAGGVTGNFRRANLDGSNVQDLVTGLVFPRGVALDPAAGKIYWTDCHTAKIQRANLDGSNVQDLVTGLVFPVGIAVDPAAGKMYWTEPSVGSPGSMSVARITRANLDGFIIFEDLLVASVNFPQGIALDPAAGKMYWTDPGSDKIQRANLDGSNVEDLVTPPPPASLGFIALAVPSPDTDADGLMDECDGCPTDPTKTVPGICGCGVADTDTDGDGVADCNDNCPTVENADQADSNSNGVGDGCEDESEGQPVLMEECGDDVCPAGGLMMPLTLLGIGLMRRRRPRREIVESTPRITTAEHWSNNRLVIYQPEP